MSRVGKMPVTVPAGVTVTLTERILKVKGPKGELQQLMPVGVSLAHEGTTLTVNRVDESRQVRSNHGLARALLNNMVTGVTKGFERRMEIQGVGFKGEVKGKTLLLSLGYSHQVEFPFPNGVTIEVDKLTRLIVRGADKQVVGETASKLKSFHAAGLVCFPGSAHVSE